MNWGGFSSGLANGFQNGIKMGKTYRDLVKEHGLQKQRDEQLAKAKKEASDKVESLVTETPAPAATPSPTTPPAAATPAADNTTPSGNAPVPVQSEPLPPMQSEAQPSQPVETPPVQPIEPPENALATPSGSYWWNSDN